MIDFLPWFGCEAIRIISTRQVEVNHLHTIQTNISECKTPARKKEDTGVAVYDGARSLAI
jgi:hypothetical protein